MTTQRPPFSAALRSRLGAWGLIVLGAWTLGGCRSSSITLQEKTAEDLAQSATTTPRVCALQLNTERHFTPVGALPTIWARQDDPVFVRVYASVPNMEWKVKLASSRLYAGIEGTESPNVTLREGTTQLQSAAGITLTAAQARAVQQRCTGAVYYHDIIIDDGLADRSLVYALDVVLAGATDTLSYPINVQRYRASYFELATGPLVAVDADVPSFALVPTGTEGEASLHRSEDALGTQVVIGGLLRPWGYNPLRDGSDWSKISNLALYLAAPLTDRTFETVYGGVAYGARGITVVGGAVVFGTREATVPLDEPFRTTSETDDVGEVTQKGYEVGWFVGAQLDTSLFQRFSGSR
jgi:hypothetical protein